MTENELATSALNIAFKIHKTLGPGLLESVYEAAFTYELEKAGLGFTVQEPIKVVYDGVELDLGFRADIIIENKLLIELKSVEQLLKVHHKIVLTYLKISNIKLGLLINFNVDLLKEGIHRKIQGSLL